MSRYLLVSAAMLVSACGGGDSGGSGSVVVTPTPSPTSSVSYNSARDFMQDRNGGGVGVRIERFRSGSSQPWETISLELSPGEADSGFVYTANPKTYDYYFQTETRVFNDTVSIPDAQGLDGDWNFDPAAPEPVEVFARYVEGDGSSASAFNYVGLAGWRSFSSSAVVNSTVGEREVIRNTLYGDPTIGTDMPTSGSSTYRTTSGLLGAADYSMNWVTGEFTGTKVIPCTDPNNCPNRNLGEVQVSGTINARQQLEGMFSGSAGFVGSFLGVFYGPQATELGLVATARHSTELDQNVVAFGKRVE